MAVSAYIDIDSSHVAPGHRNIPSRSAANRRTNANKRDSFIQTANRGIFIAVNSPRDNRTVGYIIRFTHAPNAGPPASTKNRGPILVMSNEWCCNGFTDPCRSRPHNCDQSLLLRHKRDSLKSLINIVHDSSLTRRRLIVTNTTSLSAFIQAYIKNYIRIA